MNTPHSKGFTDPTTPVGNRLASSVMHSSPHYTTTRRHSLYGTEDRIILDPGSRVWKAGFSGEGRPRDVFFVEEGETTTLWGLTRAQGSAEREEEDRNLKIKLQARLRRVFHEMLLTDPKSRKVIIVEHPLLPLYIKDMIASVLFENLQIFASRPLFPQLKTTPLAGSRLTSHLRALILMFATYLPPLTTLGGAANIPAASRSLRVPGEVLTDSVMEEIKARCCFVGEILDSDFHTATMYVDDGATEMDVPPSDSSQAEMDSAVNTPASPPSSRIGIGDLGSAAAAGFDRASGERHLQAISTMYSRYSTTTDLYLRVDPPLSQTAGTGQGTLHIPGWVRERAAEVLFEGGDVDEGSIAEVLLDALLRVPVDLRRTLASSILVVGGTAMLPGFIPRLQRELVHLLTRPLAQPHSARSDRSAPPAYDPYASIRPLASYIAILNNPSPSPSAPGIASSAGNAPAFTPATLPWVGGSLAGSMKLSGIEISRENWDEAEANDEDDEGPEAEGAVPAKRPGFHLPDWTRMPLPPGAPPAPRLPRIEVTSAQTEVGA
ncbi:hypothetical protein EW145_g5460 [Phellinidium pouzarii]|uniref:Actin-like ATPase domain-containing protein n=1 Tax=Phellinidium pouzarii TaxID=167371 RepID=A0A4V3XC51_9AGAM|nr:hypothetical protein EW145_g5460 [Phellinidium pouzarii]